LLGRALKDLKPAIHPTEIHETIDWTTFDGILEKQINRIPYNMELTLSDRNKVLLY